jgi:hypothetical protein
MPEFLSSDIRSAIGIGSFARDALILVVVK